jgi:hypothetical protein
MVTMMLCHIAGSTIIYSALAMLILMPSSFYLSDVIAEEFVGRDDDVVRGDDSPISYLQQYCAQRRNLIRSTTRTHKTPLRAA